MKKNLIWGVAIAALVFTSCSKSDISESIEKGTKLNFRVNSGKTTKSVNEVGSSDLETAASLTLYAFDRAGGAYNFPSYSDNQVTLNFVAGWTPATPVYLSDLADYPIDLYSVYPSTTVTGKDFNHTIAYNLGTPQNDELDLLVGHGSIASSTPAETEISYQHALSQIVVTIIYTNGITNTEARVNSCIVSSVECGANTYTFGSGWGSTSDVQNINYGSETFAFDGGATPKILDKFIAYPQTLSQMRFDWEIYDNENSTTLKNDTKTVDISTVTMTAGYRYYLDIVIDGALPSPTFKVTVAKWENGTRTPVPAP